MPALTPPPRPMRWSQMHIPTLREDPADAGTPSHRLLVRAGYIRQLQAGHYSLLPLAVRVRAKVIDIIRQEMNRIGAQELLAPTMHPKEIWERSGRTETMADVMFTLTDHKGAENVLALRGDPPQGGGGFVQAEGGFTHGVELIELIRQQGYRFCVGAACYPETHQECPDPDLDIQYLKAKVDAGADFLISQLFFDNSRWFEFVRRLRAADITVPVIPGLMPIVNREGIIRMTELSGAYLPEGLRRELDGHGDDAEAVVQTGIAHTTAQALELLEQGVPGIHFYTLNKSRATREIVSAIREHLGQR